MKNFKAVLILFLFNVQMSFGQYTTDTLGCLPFLTNFTSTALPSDNVVWVFGDGVSSNLKNPEHVYTKAGTFNVILKINDVVIGKQLIKVLPKLIPNIAVDTNQGCAPITIKFKNTSDIPSELKLTEILWDFGTGEGATINNPDYTYTNIGVYDIALTLKTEIPQCNATKIFESFIRINDQLNARITLDSVVPPCQFPSEIYVSNKENIDPSFKYEWFYQNNLISNNPSNVKIPADKIGIYEVLLHVNNNKGCLSKISKKIEVNPNPKLLLIYTDSLCANTEMPIYSNNSGNAFLWNFGPNAEPQSSTQKYVNSVKFKEIGKHVVTFKLTTESGCVKDTTFTIKTGEADASFDVQPDVICSFPTNVEFIAKNKNYLKYLWSDSTTNYNARVFLPFIERDSFYYQLKDSIVMSLEVESKDGCKGRFEKIILFGTPNAQFTINKFEGEAPFLLIVTDASESLDPIVKCIYNWGDGTSTEYDVNSIKDALHWYNEPGKYYVNLSVITKNGCKDDSYGAWITVHERPRFGEPGTCSASSNGLPYFCVNESVTFLAGNIPPQMDAFQFEFGQHISHCESNTSHTYVIKDAPGNYFPAFVMENGGTFYRLESNTPIRVRGAKATIGYEMTCDDKYLVNFISKSKGANSLKWIIDGKIFTDSIFSYRFPAKGDYPVILYAENTDFDCKPDTAMAIIYIRDVKAQIKHADFWCPDTEGLLDASLSTDEISGCNLGYVWTFPKAIKKGIIQTDNDSLYTLMPPGKHQISLEVRDVNGCRDTAYSELYVVYLQAEFKADREAICQGSTVTFTSTSKGDVPIINYNWNISPNTNQEIITSTFDLKDRDSILIKLVIKDQLGCESNYNTLLPTYTPVADIKYNPIVCDGLSTVLTASDFTKYGSSLSYEWMYNDSVFAKTQKAFLHKPEVGIHQIMLKIQEKSTLCTNKYNFTIQSLNTPTAIISGVNDSVYCYPKTLQLNGNESKKDPEDVLFYKWNLDNNRFTNIVNPISTYKKGRFTIKLEVISKYGCRDTAYKDIVLVGPEGALQADKNLVCKGEPITFTLINPKDVSSFYWDFGQGETNSNISPVSYSYQYVPESGKTNAALVLKSAETGCEAVVLYPINIHQVFASFVEDTICGNNINVLNTSQGAQKYWWTYLDKVISTEQSPNIIFDNYGKNLISLKIKSDSTGCEDSFQGYFTTLVKPLLKLPNKVNVCGNEVWTINLDNNLNYQMKPSNLGSINQGILNISASADKAGWIIATTAALCKDSIFLVIDHTDLEKTSFDSNITTCGSPDLVDFDLELEPNQSIAWTFNGGSLQGGILSCTDCQNPNLLQVLDGLLTATITDLTRCTEKKFNYSFSNLKVEIPNVFSPNDDKNNDTFRPVILNDQDQELTNMSLKVWNRWGQQVFDGQQAWDGMIAGKHAASEVYFFNISFTVGDQCVFTAKGDLTLIR
jgi:gliding motility-associated-like protein